MYRIVYQIFSRIARGNLRRGGRGVKKTCQWHVFSRDLGGYAAVACISLPPHPQKRPPCAKGAVSRKADWGIAGYRSIPPSRRKKTCRWHVFSRDPGGYAAVAATSLYTREALGAFTVRRGEGTPPYGGLHRICCAHRSGRQGRPPLRRILRWSGGYRSGGAKPLPYEFLSYPLRLLSGRGRTSPLRNLSIPFRQMEKTALAVFFYGSVSSSTTGQWSLPVISGQMSAFFTRGSSR